MLGGSPFECLRCPGDSSALSAGRVRGGDEEVKFRMSYLGDCWAMWLDR